MDSGVRRRAGASVGSVLCQCSSWSGRMLWACALVFPGVGDRHSLSCLLPEKDTHFLWRVSIDCWTLESQSGRSSRTFHRKHDFHKDTFSLRGCLSFKEKTCVAHTHRWTPGLVPRDPAKGSLASTSSHSSSHPLLGAGRNKGSRHSWEWGSHPALTHAVM